MTALCLQGKDSNLAQGGLPSSSESWVPSWFWLSLAWKSVKWVQGLWLHLSFCVNQTIVSVKAIIPTPVSYMEVLDFKSHPYKPHEY